MHAPLIFCLFVPPPQIKCTQVFESFVIFSDSRVSSPEPFVLFCVFSSLLVKWESGGGCQDQMAQFLGFRAYGPTSDHHLGGPKTIAGIFQSGFEWPFGVNPILSRVSLCLAFSLVINQGNSFVFLFIFK